MSDGEIILCNTEDGQVKIQLRAVGGMVRLSQMEMIELFQTTKQNINLHARKVSPRVSWTRSQRSRNP